MVGSGYGRWWEVRTRLRWVAGRLLQRGNGSGGRRVSDRVYASAALRRGPGFCTRAQGHMAAASGRVRSEQVCVSVTLG